MNVVENVEAWMAEAGWVRSSKEWVDSPTADALEARFVRDGDIVGIRVYNSSTSAELTKPDLLEAVRAASLYRGSSIWWVEVNRVDLYGKPQKISVNREQRGIF